MRILVGKNSWMQITNLSSNWYFPYNLGNLQVSLNHKIVPKEGHILWLRVDSNTSGIWPRCSPKRTGDNLLVINSQHWKTDRVSNRISHGREHEQKVFHCVADCPLGSWDSEEKCLKLKGQLVVSTVYMCRVGVLVTCGYCLWKCVWLNSVYDQFRDGHYDEDYYSSYHPQYIQAKTYDKKRTIKSVLHCHLFVVVVGGYALLGWSALILGKTRLLITNWTNEMHS